MAGSGSLRGLSAIDGKKSWSLNGRQGDYPSVAGVGGKVFIVSNPSAAAALDPVTGRQRWRLALPSAQGLPNIPLFAVDSAAVYATGLTADTVIPQYYVFAIDPFTGERKWAAYFPLSMEIGPLTVGDGVVCALSGAGKLIALDAQTGAHKWTAPGPVPFAGDISDGVVCGYISSAANKSGVVALDVSTGSVLWTVDVGGNLWGTKSYAGIVYASTFSGPTQDGGPGDLIALNARTGKTMWKRHYPEGPPTDLKPAGGVLYTGIDSGVVTAQDATTGSVLWTYTITVSLQDPLSAIVPTPSTVYLAKLLGSIFALAA